jgi:hypothetical protein
VPELADAKHVLEHKATMPAPHADREVAVDATDPT